ncbi:hypothetical protein EDD86DRAFT_199034 [Gorgonomyces haynaldii]|nr:hypothetical protein EDD86DRAFT_199034 [Gorgonomyces haynaldii]
MALAWQLLAILFHGMTIHESCNCFMLLFSKLLSDNRSFRKPIWVLSLFVVLTNLVYVFSYTAFYLFPEGGINQSVSLAVIVFSGQIPVLLTHAVVMIRMTMIIRTRSKTFIVTSILIILHVICVMSIYYFGYLSISGPQFFSLSPHYGKLLASIGLELILDCAVTMISAIVFIHRIAKGLNIRTIDLVSFLGMKHDGPRWASILIVHLFFILVIAASLLGESGYLSSVGYSMKPWSIAVVIYAFLESSYVSAQAVMETYSKSKAPQEESFVVT